MDHGADLDEEGYWYTVGGTALQFAKERKCPEIATMLREEFQNRRQATTTNNNNSEALKSDPPTREPLIFEATAESKGRKAVCGEDEDDEEDCEDVYTPEAEEEKLEYLSESSTVSSANTKSHESATGSSNSLMHEITKAIKAKRKDIAQELRRAEKVDAHIASLEAKIRMLRAPGLNYRSEEQKCDLVAELEVLDGKMERVREASRLAGEEVMSAHEENKEAFRCANCLREPIGQIHECVKCEGMLCALCLVASDRCQVCQASLKEVPPRRHRLAEHSVRSRKGRNGEVDSNHV